MTSKLKHSCTTGKWIKHLQALMLRFYSILTLGINFWPIYLFLIFIKINFIQYVLIIYSFPSPDFSQILSTSLPTQFHVISLSLSKINKKNNENYNKKLKEKINFKKIKLNKTLCFPRPNPSVSFLTL